MATTTSDTMGVLLGRTGVVGMAALVMASTFVTSGAQVLGYSRSLYEQKDLAGLGMHAQAQRSIVPSLSHTGIPSPFLQNMVARGDVGIRSGRGFYDWTGQDTAKLQGRANERLQRLLAFLGADGDD